MHVFEIGNLFLGLNKYLEDHPKDNFDESVKLLIKFWSSVNLTTTGKYDPLIKYFTTSLKSYPHKNKKGEPETIAIVKAFLELKHPYNSVSVDTKQDLVNVLKNGLVKSTASAEFLQFALVIASHDNYKDFFKNSLNVYCELFGTIIQSYHQSLSDMNDSEYLNIIQDIVRELYCFSKQPNFKELFTEHILIPLSNTFSFIRENLNNNKHSDSLWELLNAIYFCQLALDETAENKNEHMKIFTDKLEENQLQVIMETYIASNRAKHIELSNFFVFINKQFLVQSEDNYFLMQINAFFTLFKKYEVDLAAIKRTESALFKELEERISSSVETAITNMQLSKFLEIVSSLISYDPFLFESNIYEIVVDCMFKEDKLAKDLEWHETFLKAVFKVYGKDVNQFLSKLLEAMDDKLETLALSKKRKRKLQSVSDSTLKKQKTSKASLEVQEVTEMESNSTTSWIHISSIWPRSITMNQFTDIISGLNVNQSLNLWSLLNKYLEKNLNLLKTSTTISENVHFKIDFVCSMLCQFFDGSRIHEQLVYKSQEIVASIAEFNKTQHMFYEMILNIEYNNRLVNAFLRVSHDYENFHSLYFYQFNSEVKSELESIFISNQSKISSAEWKIIQQRINNFGKTEEKNNSNLLIMQQQQANDLFKVQDSGNVDDFLMPILSDDKQLEFLLQRKETKILFINLLKSKDMKMLCQFLQKQDELSILKDNVLKVISNSTTLIDCFLMEFLEDTSKNDYSKTLSILARTSLGTASLENKSKVFGALIEMQEECSETNDVLVELVVKELFRNESYKTFFKDYSMQKIITTFSDFERYSKIYLLIFSSTIKKLNVSAYENLEWLLTTWDCKVNNKIKLFEIILNAIYETPISPTGVTTENVNKLKLNFASVVMLHAAKTKKFAKTFPIFSISKIYIDQIGKIDEESKTKYLSLVDDYTKTQIISKDVDSIKYLLTTLKDAKTLNINDEVKTSIVNALYEFLNATITSKVTTDRVNLLNVALEIQLLVALEPFKSNCLQECMELLKTTLAKQQVVDAKKLEYGFKIMKILFENSMKPSANQEAPVKKQNNTFFNDFVLFCDQFLPAALVAAGEGKVILMCQVLETINVILNESKIPIDNSVIDEVLYFLLDAKCSAADDIEDFYKLYNAIGETLFIIATSRQNYFAARTPQYLNIYQNFLEAVYLYKNTELTDLTPKDMCLLLKLTLKLEK